MSKALRRKAEGLAYFLAEFAYFQQNRGRFIFCKCMVRDIPKA